LKVSHSSQQEQPPLFGHCGVLGATGKQGKPGKLGYELPQMQLAL
jgi:hypothetical protein